MGRIEQNTDMANVADTAVVTGSSSGIGLALSRMLVKNGYEVFGFGRNFERAEAQEFCKEQPEKFHAVVCDITDTQALCAHIKEIDKNYRTIGEWFVSEYEGQIPDAVRELVDAVTASKAKIAELEASKPAREEEPVVEVSMQKKCPICGAESDSKFCPHCGAPMGE